MRRTVLWPWIVSVLVLARVGCSGGDGGKQKPAPQQRGPVGLAPSGDAAGSGARVPRPGGQTPMEAASSSPDALPKGEMPKKPEGVKLVQFEFELDHVALVMDLPEAMSKDESSRRVNLTGPKFTISVYKGALGTSPPRTIEEVKGRLERFVPAGLTYLVDTDEAFAARTRENNEFRYHVEVRKTVGLVDYKVTSSRSTFTGSKSYEYSADDCMLMVYCASTLRRKTPLPEDPVAVFEELGCYVEKDDEGNVVALDAGKATDSTLALLKQFPKLKRLALSGFNFTDRAMPYVAGLPDLDEIHLGRCVSDEGLKYLAGRRS
jgi:hypothetical protein